jgi:hypothetical protein
MCSILQSLYIFSHDFVLMSPLGDAFIVIYLVFLLKEKEVLLNFFTLSAVVNLIVELPRNFDGRRQE